MRWLGSTLLLSGAMTLAAACAVSTEPDTPEPPDGSAGVAGNVVNPGTGGWAQGGTGFGGTAGVTGWAGSAPTGGGSGAPPGGGGTPSGGGGGGGSCTPGTVQPLGTCEKCGSAQRTCNSSGQWDAPVCINQAACNPGETEQQACGSCGSQTRSCSSSCTWGNWGTCSGGGVCQPGTTQGCGNCGTQTCTNSCTWGSCSGEGPCKPGATKAGSCDSCSHLVCNNNCQWPTKCALKAGNQCDWEKGYNWQCCGSAKWQFCSSSCQWYPCQACSGCGC